MTGINEIIHVKVTVNIIQFYLNVIEMILFAN